MATGTTSLATVQSYLSLPELTSEVIYATLMGSPLSQLAKTKKVTGTYQIQQPRAAAFDRATTGTETSIPVSWKLAPGYVTAGYNCYEARAEITHETQLVTPYDITSFIVKALSDSMKRKQTREALNALRGYAMAQSGLNYDAGASSTKNCAITYTPQTAVSYTDFATDGTSATVAQTFGMSHAELLITYARMHQMAPYTYDGKGGMRQTNKLLYVTSPPQIREFQTGVASSVLPFYRQYSEAEKYFDFTVGEIPGAIVCELYDTTITTGSAVSSNAGGIIADLTNKYFEGFLLAADALEELVWEEETIHYHDFPDEGGKREQWMVTAWKNYLLSCGRATEDGLFRAIHVPAK